jgi:hypothetical protein
LIDFQFLMTLNQLLSQEDCNELYSSIEQYVWSKKTKKTKKKETKTKTLTTMNEDDDDDDEDNSPILNTRLKLILESIVI